VSLIYAGIDEAGYGPLLGPLCVGMSVFRVEGWQEGEAAPDLWERLSAGVCRRPGRGKAKGKGDRRVAVDDSKALKLSNSSLTRHPLVHLERGVGAFVGLLPSDRRDDGSGGEGGMPRTDEALFAMLGAEVPREPWYRAASAPAFPVGLSADELVLVRNSVSRAMAAGGVRVEVMTCEVFGEGVYNRIVTEGGSKASATEAALVKHLWCVWDGFAEVDQAGGVRVVCDRQGGRTHYTGFLERAFPGAKARETHHSETQSRYELMGTGADGAERRMTVLFMTEGESAHLPVALASMTAKLVREMMMARFNRAWCAKIPELKPTAGYRGDAQRWLDEAGERIDPATRARLMRVV
jgi:hypothetical protein